MKTLQNHLILFDAECPMCRVYTKAFVNVGLLEENGRAAYQDIQQETCPMLDRQRAVNEIALVNQETGEVSYGIKSLFKVFGVALPALKPVFEFKPFVWLMSKMYAFIAYNRRVIVPPPAANGNFSLQPTFKLNYRLAYLLFTFLVTAYILSGYAKLMSGLLPDGHAYREYLICGGQLFFQGAIIGLIDKSKRWAYLGNMMTISFCGALLLLPVGMLANWLQIHPLFYAGWFMCVAGWMLLEHIRRSKLLGLDFTLTATWVSYRLIILVVILITI
jgi:predicted DCC family thiol-disulfide oxidoreductase YuxK